MKTFRTAIFVLALAASSLTANAQSYGDLGTWTDIQFTKSWEKPYVMARLEHRSYEQISATECWFAMAGGGYKFTKWMKADLSYEFWKIPSSGNATTHKIVLTLTETLKREGLALSMREKYELAVNPDNGKVSHTLRTRLRAQYSFEGSIFTPYVMYEFFNKFEAQPWIRSLHYVGTDIKVSAHHGFDIFYMYHLYNLGNGTAGCHLIGAGYNLSF